jgi:CBS domain-containing protein
MAELGIGKDGVMKAHELMTREVISARPDMPARQIARLLLDNGISAVPVVDETGTPIGIVSEGDLIGRNEEDREARRDWWLALLAEGETLNADFVASLGTKERVARDLMAGPVVTVDENTDAAEIARLLHSYHIKRVPVLRDGHIVGIVSRADLLREFAEQTPAAAPHKEGFLAGALGALDDRFFHAQQTQPSKAAAKPKPDQVRLDAAGFRNLVMNFEHQEDRQREDARRAIVEQRRRRVAELIDEHISDEKWRLLLHQARGAAERGEKEFLLLQFPSQLCSDGGRAINVTEPDWPTTLRGDAAEIFLRWERDLRPHGFHLAARVLDFPNGVPGDIGLFLVWEG